MVSEVSAGSNVLVLSASAALALLLLQQQIHTFSEKQFSATAQQESYTYGILISIPLGITISTTISNMATIKTAISVESVIFNEMDSLSKRLKVPRSRLFARAAEEFVNRQRKEGLLERINHVYGDPNNQEDPEYIKRIKRKQGQTVKEQW
jgi:hypothetical protein